MTDTISDLIIKIKNAGAAGKETASVSYSKQKEAIIAVLEREGYVGPSIKKGKKVLKTIEISILYKGTIPKVKEVKRVSKPSQRIYYKVSDIFPVRQGFGTLILSTPKGILTDKESRKEKVGGEALFEIW
jgi:small subunit ribosomal protein S8